MNLGLTLIGGINAAAATVTLTNSDAVNTASFNSGGNWSNGAAPTGGNDYFNATNTLRTPATANGNHVFGGDSLTITGVGNQSGPTGEALLFKGAGASGLITVSNLTINGGQLRNASGNADFFNLAGNNLTVGNWGMVVHAQGPIYVNSPVAGSGNIKIVGSGTTDAARTLHLVSPANSFTGNISLVTASQSRFALDAGANLRFVIGASNVNNSVAGSGVATFDGFFEFDLSGASTNLGDKWTLAGVSAQSFGNSFSVAGFNNVPGTGKWETATNGAFYSFNTASGLLQVVSNLSTNGAILLDSRVAFLRDAVVTTNACLMPNGSTYGRAINGISFQKDNILLTFDGYQYTAWYDTVGTAQFVWLARRAVTNTSVGAWEQFQTDAEFLNGDESSWDAHNVIALGICPADGTLHLSWDHHNNTLKYRRSIAGICTTNKAAWGSGMLNAQQNWLVASNQTESDVTYPQFTITPSGGLVLNRRIGSSGNGDQYFYHYLPIAGGTGGTWTNKTLFLSRTGTYNGEPDRNAYINGLDLGPDGKLHVTWTWRETASSANHDICYAYSADNGVTWRNNAGTVIADTSLGQSINLNSSGIIIKALDMNQLIINQQAQCVDNDGRVHVLMMHRREDPGYEYPNYTTAAYSTLATAYYHYFRDPVTGAWSQTRIPPDDFPAGTRPKIGYDAQGNVYAAYLSYPAGTAVTPGYIAGRLVIASATKAAQYTNWAVVQAFTNSFNGEPLIDQARLLADNILSVYIQENSATTSAVGTPLHVLDFAVNMTSGGQTNVAALNFSGPDSLVVIGAATGRNYQLQSAASLASGSWTNIGSSLPGVTGLIALPDPNGRLAPQRFYRVMQIP